jgi:phage gp29-like protein
LSALAPATRALAKASRFNPLRSLTPAALTTALDQFETGWLRTAALLWEAMERRDAVLCGAAGKRKRAVSRRPWEIITTDESAAAEQQKTALEYLFNHLAARDALRGDVRGGMSLLIKQMMDAVFKRSAVHELVWRPSRAGLSVDATFVPLWFFEETGGTLRYTGPTGGLGTGELKPGEWMVTTGDGIMEAISVCYLFKKLSLEDWVNFSEKFGLPGIHGLTDAVKGSGEWDDFVAALGDFANDFVTATNRSAEIKLIESSRTGDQPFQPMVERMERAIVALCRGADLGTLSSKDGAGATLQGDEGSILEEDDCQMIGETLQQAIALPALRHLFGHATPVLAEVRIIPSSTQDVAQERQTDEFLIRSGVRLSTNDLAERYGRTQADADDEIARVASPFALPDPAGDPPPRAPAQTARADDEADLDLAAGNSAAHWEELLARELVAGFEPETLPASA